MKIKSKRLKDRDIIEIARASFKEAVADYNFDTLLDKIKQGKIYTSINVTPGATNVSVSLYEAGLTDADNSIDYGIITIDPYSGECKDVEIMNLSRKSASFGEK